MKVVCLKNDITSHLAACHEITVGKIYDAEEYIMPKHYNPHTEQTSSKKYLYRITDDNGIAHYYYLGHFKPLSEIRDERIDEIIN